MPKKSTSKPKAVKKGFFRGISDWLGKLDKTLKTVSTIIATIGVIVGGVIGLFKPFAACAPETKLVIKTFKYRKPDYSTNFEKFMLVNEEYVIEDRSLFQFQISNNGKTADTVEVIIRLVDGGLIGGIKPNPKRGVVLGSNYLGTAKPECDDTAYMVIKDFRPHGKISAAVWLVRDETSRDYDRFNVEIETRPSALGGIKEFSVERSPRKRD